MKTLYDYILESLVDFKELKADLNFEKCSWKDIKKILNTDEYDHGTKLGFDGEGDFDSMLFANNKDTIFYKIIYKENLLGITGVYYFKNYAKDKSLDMKMMSDLFKSPSLRKEYKYNEVNDILKDSVYILVWQLSNKAKEKIDVNPVALVKVFYEKLIELVKSEGCKVICAHGKDSKTTKSYIKVGGFDSYADKYVYDELKKTYREMPEFFNSFVIKKI